MRTPVRPAPTALPAPPLWPVWLAIAILTLSVGGLVARYVGWNVGQRDVRLWLFLLAIATVGCVAVSYSTRNSLSRRMQTAIVLSLLVHILLAAYLRDRYLAFTIEDRAMITGHASPVPKLPDYVLPAPSEKKAMEAFDRPTEVERIVANQPTVRRSPPPVPSPVERQRQADLSSATAAASAVEQVRRREEAAIQAADVSQLDRQAVREARIAPRPAVAPQQRVASQPIERRATPSTPSQQRRSDPATIPARRPRTANSAAVSSSIAEVSPLPLTRPANPGLEEDSEGSFPTDSIFRASPLGERSKLAGGGHDAPARLDEALTGAQDIQGTLPGEVDSRVSSQPSDALGSASQSPGIGPETGAIGRTASRLPMPSRSPAATGGFSESVRADVGWSAPRPTRQEGLANNAPQRQLAAPDIRAARMGGAARDIAAAFARRAARRNDPSRRGSGENSTQVETAIERGLVYLAAIQKADGYWSLQQTSIAGAAADTTQAVIRADSAATGLALLAFLGAGYDHVDGPYSAEIRGGLQFLTHGQKSNGDLYQSQAGPANGGIWLYSHGIAAIALCEAYGMTGDENLRAPAQQAIRFIVQSQEPTRGGWRYSPGQMSDLSVSGWQLMALRSGQLAGLDVPEATMEATRRLLDRAQRSPQDASQYVYNPWGNNTESGRYGPQPSTVMTSVGLLMRLYSGWSRDDASIRSGADYLLARLPEVAQPPSFAAQGNPLRDTYYWYNATQVMFHMQGEHWEKWQGRLYPLLATTQIDEGDFAGSWAPSDPVPDRWAPSAGRLYLTALNLLSLEVYHRHLPLFDAAYQSR